MNRSKRFSFSKCAAWVFLIFSFLLLIYTYYRAEIAHRGTSEIFSQYYLLFLMGIVFWGLVLRSKEPVRVKLVMVTISLLIGIYLVEGTLHVLGIPKTAPEIRRLRAVRKGVEFDKRTKIEVILDFRTSGVDAFPTAQTNHIVKTKGLHRTGRKTLFPLASVSHKANVGNNENGQYMIYQSDRYGFNNPDREWDAPRTKWVLVGDSFAHGFHVQPGEDIGGQIRSITNESVINLGTSGNGPLAELAALKEYAIHKKPKKVLWFYYEENDFQDLSHERTVPILMKYLEPGFTQNLMEYQDEIDERLINHYKKEEIAVLERVQAALTLRNPENGIELLLRRTGWLRVQRIRSVIRVDAIETLEVDRKSGLVIPEIEQGLFPLFSEILVDAQKMIATWGGQMYFIYLPEYERYENETKEHDSWRTKGEIVKLVRGLKIPIIDIHEELFSSHDDPLLLFPLGMDGHYNEKGYKKIAKKIGSLVSKN